MQLDLVLINAVICYSQMCNRISFQLSLVILLAKPHVLLKREGRVRSAIG